MHAAISRVTAVPAARPVPRPPMGQPRKIAILGGAFTIQDAPWEDWSWELWSHASCRDRCRRQPDVLFDIHPKELWGNPGKKSWDPGYLKWLKRNHIPIYMQDRYEEVPASMKFPFAEMITQFPRGYHTNQASYMVALALMRGVTHIGVYGCHYQSGSEYAAQRGSMEYWLGVAEGRGVNVFIPPGCDLLDRPTLLYGYESHPGGKRHPSYMADLFTVRGLDGKKVPAKPPTSFDQQGMPPLTKVSETGCPPLMACPAWIGEPAVERSETLPVSLT